MNHGSLFSGFGGFDLAAECPEGIDFPSMGWNNLFHCEIEEFPRRVLKHYWTKAESYEDIKQTDFTIWRGRIDVLTGGFPCQPFSQAGKRMGTEDDRHLWPEMLRAIEEIEPTYIVGENVRGLINWNGGMVFDEVCTDLEDRGYEVQPFLLPACAVNAPHRRDRIWFVAYSSSNGSDRASNEASGKIKGSNRFEDEQPTIGSEIHASITTNTTSRGGSQDHGKGKSRQYDEKGEEINWQDFPTQPPICGGNDGLPSELDGITFSKWRRESIKGYGNAIVPQVALEIFKAIDYTNGKR